jgi:two-component system, OmpR family, sensor histidine kinase SenX3
MVVAGRRRSIGLFIALGVGMIFVIGLLYVGWFFLSWRSGILLFLGVLLLAVLISGVVLNTFFLVREIRRNEQQDAFINAVTHELKTPVASIRLYLETLQTRAVEEDKRKEFYGIMLEDSNRLMETIEQILRTGRIGHTSRKPNLSSLELGAVVEECVSLSYRPGTPITILADPDEVRAAVSNLVDNAVRYSGNNVKVKVETGSIQGRDVFVRVHDEGAGIAKTELKQIFKRFYRARGPAGQRVPGTGLGLYIVRSVAKRHGGRAWAESEGPGRGSTFVLQLPISR